MTRAPKPLLDLKADFETRIGPHWLGIVGDNTHYNGYHLGGYEVPFDDYSITHPRDVAGINQYGGDWASAIDVGMGWPASREWFWWLILKTQRGLFPDIAEIIGSRDGVQDTRYIAANAFSRPETWWGNHIGHTHISFYRDSIFRNHTYLFNGWTAVGLKPTPVVKVPKTTAAVPSASPKPVVVGNSEKQAGESSSTPMQGALLAAAIAGLAWIVKRRMEVSCEDTEQNSR